MERADGAQMSGFLELHWLPRPNNFKADLQAAKDALGKDPGSALARLSSLARSRTDYMQTLQVDRLLRQLFEASPACLPEFRLALVGSCMVEHLLAPLRVAAARRNIMLATHVGDFGQYRQEIMYAGSELYRFTPDFVLIAPERKELIGDIPLGASAEQVDGAIERAVANLVDLWRVARAQSKATIIQQSIIDTGYPLFGSMDGAVPGSPRALAGKLNRALQQAAGAEGVLFLDLDAWIENHGRDSWHDRGRWYHAKQLIAPAAAIFFADLVVRLLCASQGRSSKCLVLDLDNTLWGGVIGDDGLNGIVLGQGSGAGEAFVAFQHHIRQLSQRGVILAVCSKNDLEVAQSAFRDHPEMVLRLGDIAVLVANWTDKAANLRQIAAQLNIGTDSLVFFDDNPAEREIVRQNLPEVVVLEVPDDCVDFVRCLAESGYFESTAFTDEDRNRAQQYHANAARGALEATSTDLDKYLESLGMELVISPFAEVDMPRIVQLTNKTNQFNLTTQRYSLEQMRHFATIPGAVTLSFRLLDRFGDNGLISVIVAVPESSTRLRIDTWLMSCRVLGRQVENAVLNQLVHQAGDLGFTEIVGEYIPTPKNGMVKDLYGRLGFTQFEEIGDGRHCWRLAVGDFRPFRTFIRPILAKPADLVALEMNNGAD
jgi:FkbH-like protein